MTKNVRLKTINFFLFAICIITYGFLLKNYILAFVSDPHFHIGYCIISFIFVISLILQILFSSYRRKIFFFIEIHFAFVILAYLICFKVPSLPLLTIICTWLSPYIQIILLLEKINIDIHTLIFIIISNLLIVFCVLIGNLYRKKHNK